MRRGVCLLALALAISACEQPATERDVVVERDSAIASDTVAPLDTAPLDSTDAPPVPSAAASVEPALRAALDARVRGAAARVDSVEFSWFSGATADVIRSVTVDTLGRAVVDFVDLRSVIPNASSSAGSEALLRELNATVFGVAGVRSVEYRMAGSCELLGEWLQYGTCLRFDRPAP